ncbi:MAG: hypothetical protein AB1646_09490 [Thermodesulfobacteriota bacterium]
MSKWTNEQIIEILKNLSDQLGRKKLSKTDVASVISPSTVTSRFGNVGNALEAAGLERTDCAEHFRNRRPELTPDQLFEALCRLEAHLGHEPTYPECSAKGQYSVTPYRTRFGKWPDVLAHYRKWKAENEHPLSGISAQGMRDGNDASETVVLDDQPAGRIPAPSAGASKTKPAGQFYGEPIEFRGLRHAPINEQGVVFLFGMVSAELGFHIEAVQQGFPDCEGKYLYDAKKNLWAKARIEFEYKASSFNSHCHDPSQCDFIVCWVNDWPECPVQVIELRTEILRLPSRIELRTEILRLPSPR